MTLNQLAKELNISRTTLYNIMHKKGSYSAETEKRVYQALERYHFRRNNHARNLAKNQIYRIAFVGFYSTRFTYFFNEIDAGLDWAMEDFEDDGLQIIKAYSDREDPEEQLRELKKLEEEGVDNYIIFSYHYEELCEQIQHLINTGKNVILFSRRIPGIMPLCSVGCDDYLSGKLMAELVSKMAKKESRIQVLISEHNRDDKLVVGERLQGLHEAIKNNPDIFADYCFLEEAYTSPVPEKEQEDIRRIIDDRNPDVILDFVCNLECVAQHLQDMKKQNVLLLGFDIYPEVIPYIKNMTIDSVIYQDLPRQSYKAVELMFNYVCYGERPEQKNYYLPLSVIFSSNCEYFSNL